MLCQHGNDDRGVFRALAFVDRYGIGRHKRVQLTEAVGYGTLVKAGSKLPFVKIDIQTLA
jgi:hypothetical protein